MPAKLERPAVKMDIRLFAEDVAFAAPYLSDRNSTVTDITRELFHRYCNEKRKQLGLPIVPPYPPGTLP